MPLKNLVSGLKIKNKFNAFFLFFCYNKNTIKGYCLRLGGENVKSKVMFKIERKFMKDKVIIFLGLFLLVLLSVGGYFGYDYYKKNLVEKSILTIDVNPSVKISTNYYNKVIKVEAVNDDGAKILTDLYLVGLDAVEATNIITDRLIEDGYLSGDGANLLLTVQNADLEKAEEIKSTLVENIDKKFEENYVAGTVLAQTTTTRSNIPDNIKTLMDEYKISYSKAAFITALVSENTDLIISEIASMKINEISKIIAESDMDASDFLGSNGHGIYQSSTEQALKKVKDVTEKANEEATKVANELSAKMKEENQSEEEKIANQSAYEVAEQARVKSEEALEAANNAYEEATALANQGASSESQVQNQNSNGTTSDNGTNDSSKSESQSSGSGSSSDNGKN